MKDFAPKYVQSYLLPQRLNQYPTRSAKICYWQLYSQEHYCVNEWNKLNDNLRSANSIYKLKNYLTKFIKVRENSTFFISDPLDMKLLTRLRLNFSHLNEHQFRHNFRDTVNSMCCCGAGIETTDHYLLRCQNFALVRSSFLNRIF